MKRNKVESLVTDISEPLAKEMGLELVDVEYIREADSSYLRIYLYKEDGLSLDDCQDFSKAINPILDEKDPIPENYFLEVSSPGLDRPLKNNRDLERNIGKDVEIGTYGPINGRKNFVGELIAFDDEEIKIKESEEIINLKRKDISKINLAIIF